METLLGGAVSGSAALAVGAVGALALVGLHLLRLYRREVAVSYVPLWVGAPGSERASRLARRLRQWLALLLALAIFGLVVVGMTDPDRAAGRAGRSVVVLIDRSASMSARDEPKTRLAAARARAHAIVDGLGPDDRAMIASFAGDAIADSGFESDVPRLSRAID